MDIRNSKEIIQNILERYNFTAIYSDSCNQFGIETSKNYCDGNDALEFLYSSAIIGSKALGLFTEIPFFEVTRPLRAECLLITQTLPKHINIPVIIIKNPQDISSRITLAVKISVEHKVPVAVVISYNASNNYTDFERANNDLGRISPYINASTFKHFVSKEELEEIYQSIYSVLMQSFPESDNKDISLISLQDKAGYFPDFFVPNILPDVIKKYSTSLKAYSSEKEMLQLFFFNNYNIDIDFEECEDKIYPQVHDLLCAGCPFVNIFAKGVEKDTVIFTDINCRGLLQTYKELNYLTIDGYIGIISSEVRSSTLFIGRASAYKSHYYKFITKRGRVILLNDSGVAKMGGFSTIRHPRKLTKTKNTLYPYCCNNIKRYSKIKVKLNKCSCMTEGKECSVCKKTLCPAIYTSSRNILVDNMMCNGCLACKELCSQGAVS